MQKSFSDCLGWISKTFIKLILPITCIAYCDMETTVSIPPLPPSASMACGGTALYIYIYTHTHTHTHICIYPMALQPKSGLGLLFCGFLILLFRRTVGLLWTSDQPVAKASTYTGQHDTETWRKTSMPRTEFEPTIPVTYIYIYIL
jgi:hypothetical protein